MRSVNLPRLRLSGNVTAPGSRRGARQRCLAAGALVTCLSVAFLWSRTDAVRAQDDERPVLRQGLARRTAVSGLVTPTGIAFVGPSEMLVLEKNTGKVQHVVNGTIQNTALDLAVNWASERGLLGIALDPNFTTNHFVYLYWTNLAPGPLDPFTPSQREGPDVPELGFDTNNFLSVPLLGNRVDRFVWNGTNLTFDRNLIKLRAFQSDGGPVPPNQGDAGQLARGNHNGGKIAFGPDGKLYILIGDVGRRGQLQNLPSGPTETGLGPTVPDDQFGGPEPDDAHLTGAILRLNPDGTTPTDNPFYATGAVRGGEVGSNLQKIFAYGIRNSFGMAFDPLSGQLWMSENGDDSFDEINRVDRGFNSGWIQTMGPVSRVNQYKAIETSEEFFGLEQLRWPPTRIADTPQAALSRLFTLPNSRFSDPVFSWKYAVAPAAIGFLRGRALGGQFEGDMFMGFAEEEPLDGPLYRFKLAPRRHDLLLLGRGQQDRVADNRTKHDLRESDSFLIGTGFGIVSDIQTGPNGHLYVVSLDQGLVHEIFGRGIGL